MQIHNMERELAEYEDLKKGLRSAFEAGSLDEFGEVVTKARIARGWSQADLARVLGIKPQQVQRYESNDWQKISFWRLQEVVEALDLDVAIHARFHDHEDQDVESPQTLTSDKGWHSATVSSLGLGIVYGSPRTAPYPVRMVQNGSWNVGEGAEKIEFVPGKASPWQSSKIVPTISIWQSPEEQLKETHARNAPGQL